MPPSDLQLGMVVPRRSSIAKEMPNNASWFKFRRTIRRWGVWLSLVGTLSAYASGDALVAVATNFLQTAKILRNEFYQETFNDIRLVSGSTGKLYAQIVQGAPFDLYLAADQDRPMLLEKRGFVVPGSRRTYAIGQLALWIPKEPAAPNKSTIQSILKTMEFRQLAVANPRLAPYGAASIETLRTLKLYDQVQSRLVFGENIGQTHVLVATGNADAGLVAQSSISRMESGKKGTLLQVQPHLHRPIRQDSSLLNTGQHNDTARQFNEFLHGPQGRTIIRQAGYRVE